MQNVIDIRVETDSNITLPQVIIKTDSQSELTEKIVYAIERCIENEYPKVTAVNENTMVLLNQWDIIRIFTQNRKLSICSQNGTYESRLALSGLEEILNRDDFIRISRFEIINLRKVSGFDLSVSGTIKVLFENGTETWVARRYVKAIQEKLKALGKGVE
jgi:DNA-binding LytR/AlgR family response regulator